MSFRSSAVDGCLTCTILLSHHLRHDPKQLLDAVGPPVPCGFVQGGLAALATIRWIRPLLQQAIQIRLPVILDGQMQRFTQVDPDVALGNDVHHVTLAAGLPL